MAGKAKLDVTYGAKNYYQDDWTFLTLRPLRQRMAERLAAAIVGKPVPVLPALPAPLPRTDKSLSVLRRYISDFLCDSALPIGERVRLFMWLTGRYLRYRKYLPAKKPLRKGVQELSNLL
jgi:hypothetical protein